MIVFINNYIHCIVLERVLENRLSECLNFFKCIHLIMLILNIKCNSYYVKIKIINIYNIQVK